MINQMVYCCNCKRKEFCKYSADFIIFNDEFNDKLKLLGVHCPDNTVIKTDCKYYKIEGEW
jgi:hypothetical protein